MTSVPNEQSNSTELPGFNRARFFKTNIIQIAIFGVLVVLWLFFILAAPETFLSPKIYQAFMATVPFFGIVALPMTLLIIAGEIDLSFTSAMAVGVVAFAEIYAFTSSVELAFIACLLSGFVIGIINGYIVVRIGIPALIATIGTQFFWRGVVLVVRDGRGEVLVDPKNSWLGQVLVGKLFDSIPMQMVWFVLIAIAMWLLLNRHRFGAHTFLIGDNVNSARLMGIRVDYTRIMLFALVGVAAAFAGLIASLHVANFFTTLGEGHLLTTLASVFLGGTSVFGGTGTIVGTFIATFIIAAIQPGIVAIGLTGFWTQLIYGLVITVSVTMHTIVRKRFS